MRNWGAVSSTLFVLSFVVGLRWGAQGVANCYIAVGAVQGPMVWWAATRRGPISLRQLCAGLLPYAVALALTIAGEGALNRVLAPSLVTLILLAAAAYPLFLLGMVLTPSGRHALGDVRRQLADLLGRLRRR